MKPLRLDRLLSEQGQGSRSQVAQVIRQGRVTVDGYVIKDAGTHVHTGQVIAIDGQTLDAKRERHLMMHKPKGLLTAARDLRHPTVFDLLPSVYLALGCMPVGRLDKDTEGLLLFTSDGKTAHRLLSPRRQVEKEYLVRVTGRLTGSAALAFSRGLALKDFTCLPARLQILSSSKDESLAQVTLCEGKHRQIRRMFASLGHQVLFLKRTRFGPQRLDEGSSPGTYRELCADEWAALRKAVE